MNSWSSDGRLLVGSATDPSGAPTGIVVWDAPAGRVLRRIDTPLERTSAAEVVLVHGTNEVVLQRHDGVTHVDVDSGRSQLILKGLSAAFAQMSGDGRTLLIEREAIEGDLWLMEFRRETRRPCRGSPPQNRQSASVS